MPRLGLALVFLALASAAALAQQPASPALRRYLATPANREAVIAAARKSHEGLPEHCGTVEYRPTGHVRVEEMPRFDAAGRPVAGMWLEAVEVAGCGVMQRYNVLTIVAPGQAPQQTGLLPGSTRAAPLLQRQAIPYAFGAASLRMKDCKRFAVIDTRFDAVEGPAVPPPKPRAWRETWTVWACGKRLAVALDFTPTAQGIRVSAAPVKPATAK